MKTNEIIKYIQEGDENKKDFGILVNSLIALYNGEAEQEHINTIDEKASFFFGENDKDENNQFSNFENVSNNVVSEEKVEEKENVEVNEVKQKEEPKEEKKETNDENSQQKVDFSNLFSSNEGERK